ncbi:MAG TPA: shikimate kinase [Gammaproteobacteria bacterium]|nr:shikimate kinase [Gammaproteobacteria bacterium]
MNIILCGFKNCGKSTLGAALAKKLDFHFDDTDALLEEYYRQENNEILGAAEIYAKHGQEIFRKLESDIIERLMDKDNRVIALGGGSVLNANNVAHLHTIGKIIYLRASKELLKKRMLTSRIPAFIDPKEVDASFDKLYEERYKIYPEIADLIIDVDDKQTDEIVHEIKTLLIHL